MNMLLFITVLLVSFIVVRIGAIAFQLTGIEWSLAKFQALSCFTGTGFTTKESELITATTQRRRIASFLIVLGHAGLVTMIATFANSLRPHDITEKLNVPFWPSGVSSELLPWINLVVIVVAIYVVYKVFTLAGIARWMTAFLRKHIVKKEMVKPVFFEELTVATGGYGVSRIEVCKNSPILDKTLFDSGLRSHDITLLAIIRADKTIPNPAADTTILLGDELICFGKLNNIRRTICLTDN